MTSVDTVQDRIREIYEAAGDPSRWPTFLNRLGQTLGTSQNTLWLQQFGYSTPDVSVLGNVGKALSVEDEKKLLDACADSRSRSLLPAVLLALNTGMRYGEIRFLRWLQVDLEKRTVRVGKSKTEAGTGRTIPLNNKASEVLKFWAELFPDRESEHFVFPSERYGAGGDAFVPTVYDIDPTKAIGSWKEAWETVKEDTAITIRFHDLRHTCVTRMLEGGVPLSVVASILGWSPATTARMAKRYGHIGQVAQRQAVEVLDAKPPKSKRKKKHSAKEAKPSKRGGHKNGHSEATSLDAPSKNP
jgi:site-specific recombinase XerC